VKVSGSRPRRIVVAGANPGVVLRFPIRMEIEVQIAAILRLQQRDAIAHGGLARE
jgi:hypothetical protein